MGHKRKYQRNRQKTLSVAVQAAGLKRLFPESKVRLNKTVSMIWMGEVQPSPLSDIYTVQIRYTLRERPEVTVVEPELVPRNDGNIPHLFPGKQLCLFRYKYYEWNSRMPISDTILPWASLWLLHYEIWQATGVWCGSKQEHPNVDKTKEPEVPSEEEKNK